MRIVQLLAVCFFTGVMQPEGETLYLQDSGSKQPRILFRSDSILELTLSGDIPALWRDRGDDPSYHSMMMNIGAPGKEKESFPVRVRARGHFRKEKDVCLNPPLMINIDKEARTKGTLMAGQNKLKLVVPCTSEELIIREYLLYRIYNLLTPNSFRVRRVSLYITDAQGQRRPMRPGNPMMGFLLEPVEQMARRNGMEWVDSMGIRPGYLLPSEQEIMSVFQFLVGNTDWSVQYLHNIEIISLSPTVPGIPVPYDFDHSGLVDASYAHPPEELQLTSIRERLYRGTCPQAVSRMKATFDVFRENRKEIEKLYQETPGLSKGYRKFALDYLESFYQILDNPKKAENAFLEQCSRRSDVIIKGYPKN